MSDPHAPVTVVGAGNWLLSHDRVGPRVMERLSGPLGAAADVELCTVGSRGLGLLDHLRGQELLVVVDACLRGGEPGEVHVEEADPDEVPASGSSVHQVGPLEALAVARALYPEQVPGRVVLVLVETAQEMDRATEARACDRAVEAVEREVGRWRAARSGSGSGSKSKSGSGSSSKSGSGSKSKSGSKSGSGSSSKSKSGSGSRSKSGSGSSSGARRRSKGCHGPSAGRAVRIPGRAEGEGGVAKR